MVTLKVIKSKKVYQCDECLLFYPNRKDAVDCERWCKKNKSCNLNITKQALKELSKN